MTSTASEPSFGRAEQAVLAGDFAAALPLLEAQARAGAAPRAVHYYIGLCQEALGRLEEAAEAFDRCGLFPPVPNRKHRKFEFYAAWQAKVETRQRKAIARGMPFFCMTAVPQSASASLCDELSRLTGCPVANPIAGAPYSSADDWAASCWVAAAARGGVISHSHFSAAPRSLDLLRGNGVARILVQVRDPRQAVFSRCMGHLEKRRRVEPQQDVADGRKRAFLALDGDKLLQAMYRDLLPRYWSWLRGWMAVAQSADGPAIKIVDFREATRKTDRIIAEILAFFGVDPAEILLPGVTAGRKFDKHFRKGELAEWAEGASATTRALVESLTDGEVLEFYGWRRQPLG